MTTDQQPDEPTIDAAVWLVKNDRGLSEQERERFETWLATSASHARAWSDVSTAWSSIEADDPLIDAMRADALAARPRRVWRLAAAASAAVAAFVVAIVGLVGWQVGLGPMSNRGPVTIATDAPPTIATGADRGGSATLPDGTLAIVDRNTAVALAFTPARRDLRLLRGQATFEIRPDRTRPFAVQASDATVTATGTRFTVRTLPQGMIATLDHGSVVIGRGLTDAKVVLRPGEQVTAVAGQPLTVTPGGTASAIARQEGFLAFDDTSIVEAVNQVNQFGGGSRVSLAPEASNLRISGRFKLGDVEGFVDAVTQILPLDQHRTAGGVIQLVKR